MECEGGTYSIADPPPSAHSAEQSNAADGESDGKVKEQRQLKTGKKKQVNKSSSNITTLHSQQDIDAFLSKNDAVIIEFMTDWCGACKSIEEYYDELGKEFGRIDGVGCARINCDKNKQTKKVAASYNIKSYPVFVAFRNGTLTIRFDGADKGKLEAMFERLGGGGGKKQKGKGKGGVKSNKNKRR